MNISPHTHCESSLTSSPIATLVGRAKELGRTHFAYTDLGHLAGCLKAYGLCKPDKRKIEDLAKTNQEHLKRVVLHPLLQQLMSNPIVICLNIMI